MHARVRSKRVETAGHVPGTHLRLSLERALAHRDACDRADRLRLLERVVLDQIAERDLRDSTRSVAPLRPASDAFVIDSTGVAVEAIIERVIELGRARALWR